MLYISVLHTHPPTLVLLFSIPKYKPLYTAFAVFVNSRFEKTTLRAQRLYACAAGADALY